MKFNIITPLSRFENIEQLISHLEPKDLIWHVITDDDSNFSHEFKESWIKHYRCPNKGNQFWERCNNSINWFIETSLIENDEYYGILNDDDGYEDLFFDKLKFFISESIKNEKPNDLIICSMKRGHKIPSDAIPVRKHPIHTLYAHPNFMVVGGVGVEQFFIKGRLLKNHRIPVTTCGDGELISNLVNTYDALYLPEAYVLFNYFEPGRWNK